jgi:hypothetical protein
MMEAICSSETSVLKRAIQGHIPEDGILHSYRRKNLKSYKHQPAALCNGERNAFPVRYELGFYIRVDDILHSHRRENLKSYIALAGRTL